jgi:FkbM family methyltransferase
MSLKSAVQGLFHAVGYEVQRRRPQLPLYQAINVFDYCFHELLETTPAPFLLQIGANDGVASDPVRAYIVEHKVPALLVEPQPKIFELLQKNYAGHPGVRTLKAAVSAVTGELTLYAASDAAVAVKPSLSGLCAADRAQLRKTLKEAGFQDPDPIIVAETVPALSAADLLAQERLTHIDILQVDTEGHDWKIVRQFDLARLGVKLIQMEFCHLTRLEQVECIESLKAGGYELSLVYGDLVAYRRAQR